MWYHSWGQVTVEQAAYEVAEADGSADANVDRVRHGHWARAEPPKPRAIGNDRNRTAAGRTRTPQRSAGVPGGSKGRSPLPAPAGDPRSVAPKGKLAHDL